MTLAYVHAVQVFTSIERQESEGNCIIANSYTTKVRCSTVFWTLTPGPGFGYATACCIPNALTHNLLTTVQQKMSTKSFLRKRKELKIIKVALTLELLSHGLIPLLFVNMVHVPFFYLPFAFTIIHRSRRPAKKKNGEGLGALIT